MSKQRKLGVYICHCGGNISDYLEVEKVKQAIAGEAGVAIAKTMMFTCSDAAQEEMIEDIKKEKLDGLVVASCSPMLHLYTFRAMAKRAGLNPYQYIQVNLREQCSWAHRDNIEEATRKGISLVKGGIAKALLSEPLQTQRIETVPAVLVIGGGVAGMRAALNLAKMNLSVFLIEKADELGGSTGQWQSLFPNNESGKELVASLSEQIRQMEKITIFKGAELLGKRGNVGNFDVEIAAQGKEKISLNVGAIVVASGYDNYTPVKAEYGWKSPGVITLPSFKELLEASSDGLSYQGKQINNIVYIYCVGSRNHQGDNPHEYCSRFCCTAAVHTALEAHEKYPQLAQYHLYRDMRTYGKYELLYEAAGRKGSVFIKFEEDVPPLVSENNGQLSVVVKDQLLGGDEVEINPDLVVLVTGMIPRANDKLSNLLKLPIGKDGFYNEIHPKLRPVETVIDGVFIAGTAQGPKTLAESVASGLAAASKSAALLLKGYVELEPTIAEVDADKCKWCDKCKAACPYDAIERITCDGKEIAHVIPALCKGGGACVPVCPQDALNIKGYTDEQVRATIQSLAAEVAR